MRGTIAQCPMAQLIVCVPVLDRGDNCTLRARLLCEAVLFTHEKHDLLRGQKMDQTQFIDIIVITFADSPEYFLFWSIRQS